MELSASDDSFVWSDASNDTDNMTSDVKQEHDDKSEKNYKKKLQEKLFQDESSENPKKAKKRKHNQSNEINGTEIFANITIKTEPESDIDYPKQKKHKHRENVENDVQDSTDYDESYLNYRVKLEQGSFAEPAPVKAKKKKKHKKDIESINQDFESSDATIEESHDTSKKEDSVSVMNQANSDDDFQEKKKRKKREKRSKSMYDANEISQSEEISCIESSILNNHHLDEDQSIINKMNMSENIETTVNGHNPKENKNIKISERLRFEDDTIDYDPEKYFNKKLPKNLQRYLAANKHLSLIQANANELLTKEDEIWIIKSPHELNVKDFKDINIKLDTKGKLKFNGQAYDTIVDNSSEKIPILSYVNNKSYIQNVSIMGAINLRKRIPKGHIPEENIMFDHQPSFIPLPEIKCRHPLFGVNYKKATKIPSSVAERLNNSEVVLEEIVTDKKKKRKKDKRKLKVESESEMKVDEVPKKKRKRSSIDEDTGKKAKRIKHDPDSAEVWGSEQAIEKNLFDF